MIIKERERIKELSVKIPTCFLSFITFSNLFLLCVLRVSVVNSLKTITTKNPETQRSRGRQNRRKKSTNKNTFFYPDCTVDPGISPDHARVRSWVITTDRELGSASRTLPRRIYAVVEAKYSPGGMGRQEGKTGCCGARLMTFRFKAEPVRARGTTRRLACGVGRLFTFKTQ